MGCYAQNTVSFCPTAIRLRETFGFYRIEFKLALPSFLLDFALGIKSRKFVSSLLGISF